MSGIYSQMAMNKDGYFDQSYINNENSVQNCNLKLLVFLKHLN